MKKTYQSILILVTLVLLLLYDLFHANCLSNWILDYTQLFFTSYFPVSFIFFLLSSLLIQYQLIETIQTLLSMNTSKLYVFFLSMISGFPSGAKITKELLDQHTISQEEATQMLYFSHFPNPLFVLGPIGRILQNRKTSFYLLLSIILSNLCLLIFTKKTKILSSNMIYKEKDFSSCLTLSIKSSWSTLLSIYGISLFFYLIFEAIVQIFSLSPFFYVLCAGAFDLTKGVYSTTLLSNEYLKSFFILLFLSFGGISIHMQVKSILNQSSLYHHYVKGRILGSFLSIIFFMIINGTTLPFHLNQMIRN